MEEEGGGEDEGMALKRVGVKAADFREEVCYLRVK